MNDTYKTPVIHEDTGEILGYVDKAQAGWRAMTAFGFTIARTESADEAESVVRTEGQKILQGTWRYYDETERDWFPCIIKEVYENRVVVVRTNELGFQDAEHYKRVVIKDPSEEKLLKS